MLAIVAKKRMFLKVDLENITQWYGHLNSP